MVAGCALLVLGFTLGVRHGEPADPILETGVGGPEEPPLAVVLHGDEIPVLAAGALLRADPAPETDLGPVFEPDSGPLEMRIRPGETFYEALADRGVVHEDIMALVKSCQGFRDLTKVRRGEVFRLHTADDGGLRSLGFDLDEESHVLWVRDGDAYARHDGTYPVERRHKGIGGTVEISLYATLQDLDAPLALAAKLNDILGWDVDFSRDLRRGDTFRILYDEIWKDGEFIRTGAIQAAELVNRGKVRRAYLFTDSEGRPSYYNPDGGNLQKQLMRAPVEYSRISSGFSYNRFHPVLKRWMPHLGVDYAAPLGTPVRAGGDGTVVAASRKKGNGRYVHIRHNNREYETYYLHLSRFAKGVASGTKVRQGEVIGYVGATGYATGPHLDYRVKLSGRFVNPRQLELPAAAPVPETSRESFLAQGRLYDTALTDLPVGADVTLPAMAILPPPAWDAAAYAASGLPAGVRALR
ncbi:MAG: peptidoglycan DD-metalloendopeptidase family protein [bacterium]|nr:peptidoglycan DD-metalloendopeptidase family protein [bacterium]